MKASKQYVPVVQFVVLYKVVQTFKSEDKLLKCDRIQIKAIERFLSLVLCTTGV